MRTLSFEEFYEYWHSLLEPGQMTFSGLRLKANRILPELKLQYGGTISLCIPPYNRNAKRFDFEFAISDKHLAKFDINVESLLRFYDEIDPAIAEASRLVGLKMIAKIRFIHILNNKVKMRLTVGTTFETYAYCKLSELDNFLEITPQTVLS